MKFVVATILCLAILSCKSKTAKTTESWHGSMRGLANDLIEVMPELITGPGNMTPVNTKKLDRALYSLQNYSNQLTEKGLFIPSNDPSLKYVALGFQEKLKETKSFFQKRDHHQARTSMRELTKYCVSCHTRTPSGSSQFGKKLEKATLNMSDIQKGRFYTALRQYEKALVHYEKALIDKEWANNNKKMWNDGVIQMLGITVRVHNNANLTLEMISRLFDTKAYPQDLAKAARNWRQDALAWNKVGKKKADLQGIASLLKKAQARDTKLAHSGLILNLRALAKLNLYLKEGGLKVRSEQAVLYYTGLVTHRLKKLNYTGFPESYFKACIAANPKSRIAKKCSQRL